MQMKKKRSDRKGARDTIEKMDHKKDYDKLG